MESPTSQEQGHAGERLCEACQLPLGPRQRPSTNFCRNIFSGAASVRDYVEALERVGIVRLRRERRPNGSERIYYAPGPVTLTELAAFVERFPNGSLRATPAHPPEASSAGPPTPPEVASGAPPETSSHGTKRSRSRTFFLRERRARRPTRSRRRRKTAGHEGGPRDRADRARRAHEAKAPEAAASPLVRPRRGRDGRGMHRGDRRRPRGQAARPPRRDRRRLPGVEGWPADGALHLGQAGAFPRARGARRAKGASRGARGPARAEEDRQTTARRTGAAATRGSPPSRDELAKARAEFEELAASAAPPFRAPLEAMAARYRELERKAE